MTQHVQKRSGWRRLEPLLAILVGVGILVQVVRWGGTAKGGPLYALGIALMLGILLVFGGAVWWLYFSALPNAKVQPSRMSNGQAQTLASGIVIAGMLFLVGGFWDEMWHRTYGGFGNDFLWPPHMLLYASILAFTVFAGLGMFLTMRGAGSIRERFRSEPLLGIVGLVSSYLLVSLPSDELWHRIYGLDLTAWSLPHLSLTFGVMLIMLAGIMVQLNLLPAREWRGLAAMQWGEWLVLVLIAWAVSVIVQIGVTEWDNIKTSTIPDAFVDAFWQRPEWLYPVVVVAIALWAGNLALHTTRRIGTATLVALLVIGFRLLLITALGRDLPTGEMRFTSHLLLLAPALALDCWAWATLHRPQTTWLLVGGNVVAALVFFAVNLPIIARTMAFPRLNSTTLPAVFGYGLLMALLAGWLGAVLGRWLGSWGHAQTAGAASARSRLAWGTVGACVVVLALVLVLVLTANPPIM